MRRAWLTICVVLGSCASPGDDKVDGDVQFLKDPASGMCMPLPPDDGANVPWAGWEACANPCAGLDEPACSADPRCKPRYQGTMCPPGAACLPAQYAGCDPNPQPDPCLGLDAEKCSATPGCEPVYGGEPCVCPDGSRMCACPAIAVYRGCHQQTSGSCFGDGDCRAGQHCTTRDGVCKPPPGCDQGEVCPAVCAGICVPDDMPPPDAGCFAVHDERSCIARADCEPVYDGSDCTCDAQGCGCKDYTFDSCRPRALPPPTCAGPAGDWADATRHYTFAADGTFTVELGDAVFKGSWSIDAAGIIVLAYAQPAAGLPTRLALKGCDLLVEIDTGRVLGRVMRR